MNATHCSNADLVIKKENQMKRVKIVSAIVCLALICATIAMTNGVSAQSGTWTTKAPMLEGRAFPGAGVINGKLYVAGGSGPSGTVNTLQIYDSASDVWSYGPAMTTFRAAVSGG